MAGLFRLLYFAALTLTVLSGCSDDGRKGALIIDEAAVLTDISESLRGHLFYGYLLLMLKKPEKAIRSFEKGLELDPDNIYGLCKLARAHNAMKEKFHIAEAESILEKAMKIDPDHIRVQWLKRELGK